MPLYESTFIARHDMSAQQVEGLAENFANIIKEKGGEVAKTELWGLKTLAYRIKKNRKGHYIHFNINAPIEAMGELERNLRLSEDVLRYLTIRVDALDAEPSIMMQAKSSRDDRSRRGGFGRGRGGFSDRPRGDGPRGDRAPVKSEAKGEAKSEVKAEASKDAPPAAASETGDK